MSFLSSLFLWALPAMALPIVVHLMAKRRKTVIPWGAMQFLIKVNAKEKRSWRLKDLLLLLLRVLVLACFILALARPLVPARWLGGHDTRDVILILDQSLSTRWDFGGETVYERQLVLLDEALQEVEATDFLRCLIAKEKPRWLASYPLKADRAAKEALRREVARHEPDWSRADILASLEEAWAAEPAHPNAERHVILITDAQSHGWMPEQMGRWLGIGQRVAAAPAGSVMRTLRAPRDPEESLDNMAITSLSPNREIVALSEPVELTATVQNFGRAPSASSVLHWRLGEGEALGLATVPALEPGASTTVKLEHRLGELGIHELLATVESGDGLPADNLASTRVEVATGIPVLVVDKGESDSRFLEAALGDFTEDHDGVFRGRRVTASDLAEVKLSDYRAVILTDLSQLDTATVKDLHNYVGRGGSLWLAPNLDAVPHLFNELFASPQFPLAPARLASATGDPGQREKYEMVSPPTQLHPATVLLADTERLDLDEIRIYRRFTYQNPWPSDLSVLLRGASGHPLVVETSLGRGRVILQAFPLGPDWSNLPALQVYVAMVYEWLWYLAEPALPRFNLARGQAYEIALPARPAVDRATLTPPGGGRHPVTITRETDGLRLARATDTIVPGDYLLELASEGQVISSHRFQVERDAAESDLTPLDEEPMSRLRVRANMLFDEESDGGRTRTQSAPVERRQEPLWFWLLVGVLLFLVGESALACSIAKSRSLTRPGAQLTGAR